MSIKAVTAHAVQEAAAGKSGLAIGATMLSAPAWMQILESAQFKLILAVIGIFVSISVILVNWAKLRQSRHEMGVNRLREALLRKQAEDQGIDVD